MREPLYGYSEPGWCDKHCIEFLGLKCPECRRDDELEAEWSREESEWEEWHAQEP